jgi:hypothetical protein
MKQKLGTVFSFENLMEIDLGDLDVGGRFM